MDVRKPREFLPRAAVDAPHPHPSWEGVHLSRTQAGESLGLCVYSNSPRRLGSPGGLRGADSTLREREVSTES